MFTFLCAYIRQQSLDLGIGHRKPLVQVTQGCSKFSVRTAKLSNDDFSELWVGILDIDGILKFTAISLLYIRLIRNPHSA